jgi:hypothetical protein
MPRRVIVDADAGPGTEIWQKFQNSLRDEFCEYLFLTEVHVGIPDVEILDKLLQEDDTLLTGDCVLHMRALARGCRSFTVDERNQELTSNPLPYVDRLTPLPNSVYSTLLPDYRIPVEHPLTRRLKTDFTERQAKGYRTARRRIRSHFGAAVAIAQVSMTIGSLVTSRGLLCGLVMHLAGNSGVKGLRATESYCLVNGPAADPACPVIHALRDQYLLQLDHVRTELFVIPPTSLDLTRRLLASEQVAPEPLHEGLRLLLRQLTNVTVQPCVKGRFHDGMQAKLSQLVRSRTNEIKSLDVDLIAQYLCTEEASDDVPF